MCFKRKMFSFQNLLVVTIILVSALNLNAQTDTIPYVVVLSMDGFRWDYTQKTKTPNLDSIAHHGVKAVSLKPSFPTKTFPNHYSIATGLYPDHHNIVANNFFDAKTQTIFAVKDRKAVKERKYYGGEPIWITAEKQSVRTASYFWVGSDVEGLHPTYWKNYDQSLPFTNRIDSVIGWLNLPEKKRPHLIMWYMHEPDAAGHRYGPYSSKTLDQVKLLDSLIGVYMKKINQLPIAKKINLIFVSDHGMELVSKEKIVNLSKYIIKKWYADVQGENPFTMIKPEKKCMDSIYNRLKKVHHIKVWKKNEIPERLHYGTNANIYDIVVVADSSWSISWGGKSSLYFEYGEHGYDNNNTDLHGIFYAIGPAFKVNYIHPTFENVNIYPIIAKILKIKPAKVDGKIENVIELFAK